MALGGGTFLTQNKVIPGTYINFVSAAGASAELSERGIVAMPVQLNWGPEDQIFTVEAAEFQTDSFDTFGYAFTDDEMKKLRELFKGAKTAHLYRSNSGGVKASVTAGTNLTATAKYSGTRGNDITIIVQQNVDDNSKFDVITKVDAKIVDTQELLENAQDVQDNAFVVFTGTGALDATAGAALTGGTNGTADGTAYQDFLDKAESKAFSVLAYAGNDETTKGLFEAYVKRLRDDQGIKFQLVLFQYPSADFEGAISVDNEVTDADANVYDLVYWTAGQSASVQINRSLTNNVYTGEYTVDTEYTQAELEDNIENGKFTFHEVGDDIRVLKDINTFISFTVEKTEDFANNQVVRILDQISIDTAVLFNERYLGKVQNNEAGRTSFWKDIVKLHEILQNISAIENFEADDITVEAGESKDSVVVTNNVEPVSAMAKLYMTVYVA